MHQERKLFVQISNSSTRSIRKGQIIRNSIYKHLGQSFWFFLDSNTHLNFGKIICNNQSLALPDIIRKERLPKLRAPLYSLTRHPCK